MNKLRLGFKSAVGRNRGRISSYHRESGKKQLYTIIDFGRTLCEIKGKIKVIRTDSHRTSKIAGIAYTNGIFSYMLAIEGMKVGDFIFNTLQESIQPVDGVTCKLIALKAGDRVHNLEFYPGSGGKIARSAGTFTKIVKKYKENVLIKLQSSEFRLFLLECLCTIGRVSNINHQKINLLKAGTNRLLGWRPVVRGRAMNPVDHPHGGRTNGGIVPRTPWGKLTRGVKTAHKLSPHVVKKEKNR